MTELEGGYYWVKEFQDQEDWEISRYDPEYNEWFTMGWDMKMPKPPVQIGPKIPQYTGESR